MPQQQPHHKKIANTGLYAHYVFNTLDQDHSGIVSFEVSFSLMELVVPRNLCALKLLYKVINGVGSNLKVAHSTFYLGLLD